MPQFFLSTENSDPDNEFEYGIVLTGWRAVFGGALFVLLVSGGALYWGELFVKFVEWGLS